MILVFPILVSTNERIFKLYSGVICMLFYYFSIIFIKKNYLINIIKNKIFLNILCHWYN